MSFPAIAIGGHLSVYVGDRLVCGVWRRAPSGEQASRPLIDSRQQPFCNFVSKVVGRPRKGPHLTGKMGMKPRISRGLAQICIMRGSETTGSAAPKSGRWAPRISRWTIDHHAIPAVIWSPGAVCGQLSAPDEAPIFNSSSPEATDSHRPSAIRSGRSRRIAGRRVRALPPFPRFAVAILQGRAIRRAGHPKRCGL